MSVSRPYTIVILAVLWIGALRVSVKAGQPVALSESSLSATDSTKNGQTDSTDQLFQLAIRMGELFGVHKHAFIITSSPYEHLTPFQEGLSFMDFNRVNGFVLGLATPSFVNIGRHEELGIRGGITYGFAEHKGQSQVAGEYRIPLSSFSDTTPVELWRWVPTLALGAEYHDMTSTEDYWRTDRYENMVYAFFAREDFRDYFKIDGWNASMAFRPTLYTELRVEYRSDIYYDQLQRVFYGRFGGNKVLPENPPISTGRYNSWVITAGNEEVNPKTTRQPNVFGDNVFLEYLKGHAFLLQLEFGSNPAASTTYASYLFEARGYVPIISGISFDTRLRLQSVTGDVPIQKLLYLGGPSTLAAYKNKIFAGNRMALLNTELRFSLTELSSFFQAADVQLLFLNDFGFLTIADSNASPLKGFQYLRTNTIAYNTGIGIGHTAGIQLGVMFRTDISGGDRFFLRFKRPF